MGGQREATAPFAPRRGRGSEATAGDALRRNNPKQKETPPCGDVGPAIRSLRTSISSHKSALRTWSRLDLQVDNQTFLPI